MNAHVSNFAQSCYFELRRLSTIHGFLTSTATATALPKVVNDLFLFLNKGNISVLALLHFSSKFDTIDLPILDTCTDTVLQWFSSYVTDRTHYISI